MNKTPFVCTRCRTPISQTGEYSFSCDTCGTAYPRRGDVDTLLDDVDWEHMHKSQYSDYNIQSRYAELHSKPFLSSYYYDWWVDRMFSLVADQEGVVLELMCGEAEACLRLPQRFSEAIALDLNIRFAESATRRLARDRRVRCVCASAANIPLPDRSVDVIIIQGGLHHARPLLPNVLDEIRRVLSPQGCLIASEPANDNIVIRTIRRIEYRLSSLHGKDEDEDGFTRKELQQLFAAHGLRLESYERIGFLGYVLMGTLHLVPLLKNSKSRVLGNLLIKLDHLLSRVPIINRFALISVFSARVS